MSFIVERCATLLTQVASETSQLVCWDGFYFRNATSQRERGVLFVAMPRGKLNLLFRNPGSRSQHVWESKRKPWAGSQGFDELLLPAGLQSAISGAELDDLLNCLDEDPPELAVPAVAR